MGLTERHWFENEDVPENYEQDLEDAVHNSRTNEKRDPVEPIAIKQEMFDEFYGAVSCCPKCDCMWIMYRENDMHYCPECGQELKWE